MSRVVWLRSPKKVTEMVDAAVHVVEALAPNRRRFLDFVRARVGDDAEDVLQVAMLRAALKAETLHDASRVHAWFYRILRNAIADHRARAGVPVVELDEAPEPTSEPERDVCACSMSLLASLRPEYAEILRLVDLDEQSLAEAAAVLGITSSNAAVRLHRARKSMREALLRFCGTDSMRACLSCGCDA